MPLGTCRDTATGLRTPSRPKLWVSRTSLDRARRAEVPSRLAREIHRADFEKRAEEDFSKEISVRGNYSGRAVSGKLPRRKHKTHFRAHLAQGRTTKIPPSSLRLGRRLPHCFEVLMGTFNQCAMESWIMLGVRDLSSKFGSSAENSKVGPETAKPGPKSQNRR